MGPLTRACFMGVAKVVQVWQGWNEVELSTK